MQSNTQVMKIIELPIPLKSDLSHHFNNSKF